MAKNRPAKKDNNKEKKGKKEKGVGKRMKKEEKSAHPLSTQPVK